MKAKLIIEDKEIEVEISEEEYKKLQPSEEKKTGYERVLSYSDKPYYCIEGVGNILALTDTEHETDNLLYESANYYSDKTVAENNARADKLMRQLRRFAVEHRGCGVDFNDTDTKRYYIYYDYGNDELGANLVYRSRNFGAIYFDSEETAEAAIDEFHDELIWYFTEYKDSL